MAEDSILTDLMAANAVVRGDRAGGRNLLQVLWARIEGDPFYACVVAHHMADAQDDLNDELAWDIRALEAALRWTDADEARHNTSVGLFMPSVHVNLAEDYFKLADFARSRDHLATARSFIGHLGDDTYGQMIRGGIARLAKQLEAAGEQKHRAARRSRPVADRCGLDVPV